MQAFWGGLGVGYGLGLGLGMSTVLVTVTLWIRVMWCVCKSRSIMMGRMCCSRYISSLWEHKCMCIDLSSLKK